MTSDDADLPTDFARRLWEAMADEKKSPTRTEREAKLQRGYMSQIKSGKIRSPGPDVIRLLADYLSVGYEWLAIGRGAKRSQDWAPSALERAMTFALANGGRRDAIESAIERYRGEEMSGTDWILAFNTEAVRLERAGVPRPEATEAAQKTVRRMAKKERDLLARRNALAVEIAQLEARRERGAPASLPETAASTSSRKTPPRS